jgi:hypothetical protein
MARAHDSSAEGSRIRNVPSLGPRTGTIARQAQTRGLPRLPLRVERPKDVFNPSVLNVRLVQGASRAGGFAEEDRILSNAMPANGLSASTSDRSEAAECNAPPSWVVVARQPTATLLKLTPMGSCRTRGWRISRCDT